MTMAPEVARRGRSTVVWLAVLCAVMVGLAGGLLLWYPERPSLSERLDPLIDHYGGSPVIGGAFALEAADGAVVTENAGDGRLTLLFFGFTHCPDVCPAALLKVSQALDRLSPEQAALFRPLFVSVDPERDSPAVLAGYVSLFHPSIVGATSDPATLAEMAKRYRAHYARVELDGGGYTVDHSTVLYLVDGDGRNLALFNHATEPARLAEALGHFADALETGR